MSRPNSLFRNPALAPIPESSPARFQPSVPSPLRSGCSSTSEGEFECNKMTATCFSTSSIPRAFYHTPENAAAAFSTHCGRVPKRQLVEPSPPPIIRSNLVLDVQKKAHSLMMQFPELARTVVPIDPHKRQSDWYHLYKYFDAVDLWIEGVFFCYYVIHRIATFNEEPDIEPRATIDKFAKQWIIDHQHDVVNAPPTIDLFDLFDELDKANWKHMRGGEMQMLSDRLNHHRHALLSQIDQSCLRATRVAVAPAGPSYPSPLHTPTFYPAQISSGRPQMVNSPHGVLPHQSYQEFIESQRNQHETRFNPVVPPGNVRNENNNRHMDTRPHGWSNDIARNGRGGRFNTGWNNSNQSGRRWTTNHQIQTSPPKPMSPAEPIYVLTKEASPQGNQPTVSQRIFSAPIRQEPFTSATKRAFSDSPGGPGVMRSDSSTRAMMSNDARVSGPDTFTRPNYAAVPETSSDPFLPELQIHNTRAGGVIYTYNYSGSSRRPGNYENNSRTVYVSNMPWEMFHNHSMKEMLSRFGPVDTINFLKDQTHCFATFMDESSVMPAIDGLDRFPIGPNLRLVVNVPRGGRNRSVSYSSQRSLNSDRPMSMEVRDHEQYPRPSSIRGGSLPCNHHARNFSRQSDGTQNYDDRGLNRLANGPPKFSMSGFNRYPNFGQHEVPGIEGGLEASLTEVVQHRAALDRIENQSNRGPPPPSSHQSRRNSIQSQFSQNNRKENSPMKSDRPPPSRQDSFTSEPRQAGGKNKRRYPSRQNSLVLSTPAASPAKLRQENAGVDQSTNGGGDLKHVRGEETSANGPTIQENHGKSVSPAEGSNQQQASGVSDKPKSKNHKKNKKNKNKNATPAKPDSEAVTQSSNASSASNPGNNSFTTESSSFEATSPTDTKSFTMSKNTSSSTLPSRKPSVISTSSVSAPISEGLIQTDMPEIASIPTKSVPPMNPVNKEQVRSESPKNMEIDEHSTTPKASHLLGKGSDIETKQPSASGKRHSKKESVSSTSSSLRKADVKSTSGLSKADTEPKTPELAKIRLDDQSEFPSLGKPKSPASAIADGKRPPIPAAVQQPAGTMAQRVASSGGKKSAKPAVPVVAVPRTYMPRPQPVWGNMLNPVNGNGEEEVDVMASMIIGTRAWPFVKKFRGK